MNEAVEERARYAGFDALRLIAAFGVLFSHVYATRGLLLEEPLWKLIPGVLNVATASVCCFFAISGYLVTQSFCHRSGSVRGTVGFVRSRILRIFPGYLTCIVATTFVGAFISSLSTREYWLAADTWRYLYSNLTLQNFNTLPGVFAGNPAGSGVNGSLWTIPLEVGMYAMTLIYGLVLAWQGRWRALVAAASVLVWCVAWPTRFVFYPHEGHAPCYAVLCYVIGAVCAVWALKQRAVALLGISALALLVASLHAGVAVDLSRVFAVAAVALMALWLGRLGVPVLRQSTRWGDLSYGVFLYSSLVMQTLIWANPNISLYALMLASSMLSVVAAFLSWHLVERRALQFKRLK
ncbi:MAG: acyltransferase [Casimicrobium sp.]